MIILSSVVNYPKEQVEVFWNSLTGTGYRGDVVIFANDCGARTWLKEQGAMVYDTPKVGYPISSARYLAYSNFLKGIKDPVLIADIRDVVFQKNPEYHIPTEEVNVFEETRDVMIGNCSANTLWMNEVSPRWRHRHIICSGLTSGHLEEYCSLMWNRLEKLPKITGIDQAAHIDLIYSGDIKANIHQNEESEIYTVAYLLYKTLDVNKEGFILNAEGKVPCIVHQYDRHDNLEEAVRNRLNIKEELKEAV